MKHKMYCKKHQTEIINRDESVPLFELIMDKESSYLQIAIWVLDFALLLPLKEKRDN